MNRIRCEINWGQGYVTVNPPRNIDGIMIDVLFTSQHPNASLSGVEFEWTGDEAAKFNARKNAGLSGGVGICEGPAVRLFHPCGQPFWEGFANTADPSCLWSCDLVVVPLVQFARVDWIGWRARAISFGYLASLPVGSPGRIIPAIDYKKTPYCVTRQRSKAEQITIYLTLLGLAMQIYDTICRVGQLIDELIGDATSTAATLGAMIATLLADLLKIILYVAYLLAVIIAFISLIIQLISYYIQLKKFKLCMKWETGFKRICEYFGMAFSSTILQNTIHKDQTWMPNKKVIPDYSNPLSVFKRPADEANSPNAYGHPDENCEQFLLDAEKYFDAEINIRVNPNTGQLTMYFENRFFFNNIVNLTIPNTGPMGYTFNYPGPYKTNLGSLPFNMLVEYQVDDTDEMTRNRYEGTTCQCTVTPINVDNDLCVTQNTGVTYTLPFAQAKPKLYLNEVENLLNQVFQSFGLYTSTGASLVNGIINVANGIINVFGGNSASPLPTFNQFTPVSGRINWLEVSSDDFAIKKTFIGYDDNGEWKIHPQNLAFTSAEYLFKTFHGKNLPTRGNQQRIYEKKEFPFCCEDYLKILNGNVITCPDGGLGKLISLQWNVKDETAVNVTYCKFVTETTNLKETIIIDGN